jgi:modulator of FtsH protease
MSLNVQHKTRAHPSVLASNKVLRNTYILLSMTLILSAVVAGIATITNAAPPNFIIVLVGYIGLPILIQRMRNSHWALVITFGFTAFVGWTLGPILNYYIHNFTNGPQLIMIALGSTGIIFLTLSAVAMNTKRDFTSWGHFLVIGTFVAIIAMFASIFLHIPTLQLALAGMFALISGGFILYQTNMIVRGGETNYISATIILYISILRIFLTLLQLLGAFGGNRN